MSLSLFRSSPVSSPERASNEASAAHEIATDNFAPDESSTRVIAPVGKTPIYSAALHGVAPALLLLGLCLAVSGAKMPEPLRFAAALPPAEVRSSILNGGVLPLSQTLLVEAGKGGGSVLWRGRLEREVSVVGKAPLAGQVARVMVNEGQFVNTNDRVLQISSGAVSRPPARMEAAQTQAERAQVAAYNAQENLQLRMNAAREKLAQAQNRVQRAHERIEEAESLIERLKRGETVADPSTQDAPEPRREVRRETSPVNKAAERAAQSVLQRAERQLAAAKQNADAADAESQSRARELLEARGALDAAQKKLEAAKAAPAPRKTENAETPEGEARPEAEAPTNTAEISGAQNEVSAARGAVAKAESAASAARKKARDAQSQVAAAQSEVNRARAQLREALQRDVSTQDAPRRVEDLPLFADNDEPAPRRARASSTQNLSVAGAVKLVRAATRESAAATAEAERLKAEIEGYERQVRETQQRFEQSAQSLETAQERVMEHTIQTNLSVVRAPASGTVLWVAPLAKDVREGEAILTVGRNDVLTARFQDTSGLWKKLKEGDTLPAVISGDAPKSTATPAPPNTSSSAPQSSTQNDAVMGSPPGDAVMGSPPRAAASGATPQNTLAADEPAPGTSPRLLGTPITVKIREIETTPDGKAMIEVAVFNPRRVLPDGRRKRRFAPGMQIVCSAGAPGASGSMSVPSAAVMRAGENAGVVAVLVPRDEPSTQDASTQDEHRVEWRPVVLGKSDGVQQEIKGGLQSGERIALQPATLRAWVNASGPDATLRLG